jgi:hypothetical protein
LPPAVPHSMLVPPPLFTLLAASRRRRLTQLHHRLRHANSLQCSTTDAAMRIVNSSANGKPPPHSHAHAHVDTADCSASSQPSPTRCTLQHGDAARCLIPNW